MKKIILSVIGIIAIIVASAIGKGIGILVGKEISKPNPEEIEKVIIEGFEEAARIINRDAPVFVDKETKMDKATVGPGSRITYHHTLMNYSSTDVDAQWLKNNLLPIVKSNVCKNNNMRKALQHGGIYGYSYSGKDGVFITDFAISKDECRL